ncbi:MAG: hypothetical protein WBQ43_16205 [Terriglobales bacterium]
MTDETLVATEPDVEEIRVLTVILNSLRAVGAESRERILHTAATYFGLNSRTAFQSSPEPAGFTSQSENLHYARSAGTSFSEDRRISPKEFIFQKQPRSDVEKVACLAFYLTHYRDTPHFKTLDISKLNTESAQVKFSNAAVAVENSTKKGFLVPAEKGQKQLSTVGEQYVLALPDRDAAQNALAGLRKRRKARKGPLEQPPDESTQDADGQQGTQAT